MGIKPHAHGIPGNSRIYLKEFLDFLTPVDHLSCDQNMQSVHFKENDLPLTGE